MIAKGNSCHFADLSILEFILKIFVCFALQRTRLNNQRILNPIVMVYLKFANYQKQKKHQS